ncbi:MAG: TRAP transporter small permease [Oscillospiraceae bacterium]|nr:TRAP transporter small permease [Oscillospiraceae bacterium]
MKNKAIPVWLLKFDRGMFRVMKGVSYVGGFAVIVVMLMSLIDVILAKLFHSALPSATEWVTYLNILIVYPPFAYVQLERGHTRVDLFEGKMSHAVSKTIRIISLLLATAVMAFLTQRGYVVTMSKFLSGESSSVDAFAKMSFKIWIFGVVYTVGCGLGTISFLWSVVREFIGLSIYEPKGQEGTGDKEVSE